MFCFQYLDFNSGIPADHSTILFNEDKKVIGNPSDVLLAWWKAQHENLLKGEHKNLSFINGPMYFLINDKLIPIKVTATILIDELFYFRNWPISETSGLENQLSKGIVTHGFTLNNFNLNDLRKNWTKISAAEVSEEKFMISIEITTWGDLSD